MIQFCRGRRVEPLCSFPRPTEHLHKRLPRGEKQDKIMMEIKHEEKYEIFERTRHKRGHGEKKEIYEILDS